MVSERRKSALVLCVVDVSWGEKEIEEIKKGVQWQLQTKRCKSASIIILLPTECEGSGLDCSLRREVASLGKSIQLKVSYLPTPFNKEDHSRQLEPYFTKIIYTTFIYCSSGTFEVLKDNNVFPVIEVIPNSDGGDDSYYRVFQTELDNYPNPNYISIVGDTLPSYTSEVELKTFEKFVNTKLPELPIRSCLLDVVSFFGSSDSCSNSKKILTVAACTGSGKSTQIPVALLKWYQIHRKPVRIAVIMPRRLTVSNVYKTVSQSEAMKGRSELIGFKIGSQHYNPNAQLVFQTVGCFVNDLIFRAQEESQVDNQKLFPYSHIIIDEYHLKSAEMELLCGIVRHEYFTSGKSFHILGMTATMSKSHLLLSKEQQLPSQIPNYLHEISLNTSISRQFVVEKKDLSYLSSDLSSIEAETRFCVEGDTAALKTVTGENAEKEQLVRAVEGRLDLISDIIDLFIKTVPSCRVVLIFLPGIAAIRSAEKQLRSCSRRRYSVLKLHSSLKHENSIVTCGLPSDEESHSVILATNTAELGVTLPEVDLLIDSCLERVVCGGGLKTDLCSLDSLVQREGRVGRCKNGIAVKLLFRSEFGILLNESSSQLQQQVPESTLLAALTFGSAAGVSLIKLFSTVNWEEDAENNEEQKLLLVALHNLLSMGAACKRKDKVGTNIYTLTDTGVFLQLLPVDPKIGQLIGKARYLGSDELQLSIETSVCCSVSPLQLCGSQAFVLNAANSSNSSVISSVNILHFYRSLKYISEDETELRQRSEEFSILVDGCEELLQKMADICSILSRYDLFVSPPTACLPLSHREMITISVLFAITFRRSLFAYVPPSVDFTAGRFADIPVGFVKRYSVALKESLSKQQIEELTACRVNKVSGGSKVKTKLAGDDKEPTKFPHKVKKEKDKQKSAKTEAKDKKEKRGKRRKVCYCEMEMSSAVATVWDRPNAVWMMERRGLGVSGTCGKLKPIFKSSSPPPRILFDPILLPASELHPPEECPAVIREVFGPLIVTATEFGDCVLPASVAGLLSVVLLLSEKFVCSRKQERIDPPEALFKKLLISVEGFSGISVSTSSVTSAFSSPDFMLTFNSVYNALNHGVRSDNFGDLIDHLLMSSRRDQVLAGFSGSASIWRNDSSFVDLFPTCFQSKKPFCESSGEAIS